MRTALQCAARGCDGCRVCKPKPVRESDIEKHLVARVKEAGGVAYKWVSPGRVGVPDRIVVRNGDRAAVQMLVDYDFQRMTVHQMAEVARRIVACYVLMPELKAPGKKPEPHQQREHDRLRALGMTVDVIDSKEGAEALFK